MEWNNEYCDDIANLCDGIPINIKWFLEILRFEETTCYWDYARIPKHKIYRINVPVDYKTHIIANKNRNSIQN